MATFFVVVIFVVAVWGLLSYKPIVIDTSSPWVESFLKFDDSQVKLRKLKVWFDGHFKMQGQDGEILNAEGEPVLNISKVYASFSNRGFLKGIWAPKHIVLDGLSVDIQHEVEGAYIAGFPLKKSQNKADVDDGESKSVTLSFIEYLNNEVGRSPYFNNFKSLEAKNVQLQIYDNVNLKNWSVKDARILFEKNFLDGERLAVEGKFSRPGIIGVTPAKLTIIHPKYAPKATATLEAQNITSAFFDDYFPFKSPVKAKGSATLSLDILEDNSFEDIYVRMNMREGSIHVTPAYNFPFGIAEGELQVRYDYLNDKVTIEKLAFTDSKGWPLEVTGDIFDVTTPKDMRFDLKLESFGETTVSHVAGYLPDKRIRGAVNWIRKNVHSSKVKNLKLAYYGTPSQLPFCDKLCGFDGSFDFEDLSLSFLKNTEAAQNLNGRFVMKDDYIQIESQSGMVEGQQVADLKAVIAGHFTKDVVPGITLSGELSGPIEKLLNVIDKETGPAPWPFVITGQHRSKGSVYIPFKNLSLASVKYNFVSQVEGISTTTLAKGYDILVPKGQVNFSDQEIKMQSPAVINGMNVNFEWYENMQKPMQETFVSVWGDVPEDVAVSYVPQLGLDVSGSVATSVQLKAQKLGLYDLSIYSDLTANAISQTAIKYTKPSGVPLSSRVEAVLGDQDALGVYDVSITGQDVSIEGVVQGVPNTKVDLKKFQLSGHDLKVAMHENQLNLVGRKLNLSQFDLLKTDRSKSVSQSQNLAINVNVEKVVLPEGEIEQVVADIETENANIKNIEVVGKNGGEHFDFKMLEPSTTHQSLRLKATAVGDLLKELGILKTLRSGYADFRSDVYMVDGKKQGRGLLKIKKTYMVEAPIMAKLLSLISLKELLSSKDGIYFEEVEIPLMYVGDEIIVDHAFLSGPSIGIRLRGKVNTVSHKLNLEGQLIPAEGINSFIAQIPLLGDLLTGSQSGLLVADFKIKGSVENPKVSANPLSFVLPGIVKDFFGTLYNRSDITKPESAQ
tara:strand:+ start:1474 stop:4506 length:3033 start_codon:yes stop_codon:yes gene_type:complete